MKKRIVIHPFLFGLFFVLALYSANVHEVSPSQVVVPALVVLTGTAAMLFLAWVMLRSIRKAALLTSIGVILCFSYGHAVNIVVKKQYNFFAPTPPLGFLILIIWAVIFGISIYFIWFWKKRWDRHLPKLTTLLNIASAVLIILPLATIVFHHAMHSQQSSGTADSADLVLSVPQNPPDIYYIVLDRYAGASTLQELFDFDNSEFIQYLTDKGFYVPADATANYMCTTQSLSSSLNMVHLTTTGVTYAMLRDYRVWRLLKSAGYEFIHVGSWWEATRENRHADVNINYAGQISEFSMTLLRTTVLDVIGRMTWDEPRMTQWERIRYEFRELGEIPNSGGAPKFVFAHLLTPHPDYVFRSDGSFLPSYEAQSQTLQTQYLNQLVSTNNMVRQLVESLLAESRVPPIIILQSDEGPYPDLWDNGLSTPWPDVQIREKALILNAYYLPGAGSSALYPSITPVNSFRLVFDVYFGTHLGFLPDTTHLPSLDDVTDRLPNHAG